MVGKVQEELGTLSGGTDMAQGVLAQSAWDCNASRTGFCTCKHHNAADGVWGIADWEWWTYCMSTHGAVG
jgi:hypothetical protein